MFKKKTTVIATPAQLAAARKRRYETKVLAKFGVGCAIVLAASFAADKLLNKDEDDETLED